MDRLDWFPAIGDYRFELQASEPIRLPGYAGSAWRGLLGHSLRRSVCVTRQPRCDGCLLRGACVYSTLFETPPLAGVPPAHLTTAAPHPFVLVQTMDWPSEYRAGGRLDFGIRLLGEANRHLPYLVHALHLAGELGIGPDHGRFRVLRVLRDEALGRGSWVPQFEEPTAITPLSKAAAPEIPDRPHTVSLQMHTPIRVKRQGQLVGPAEFEFADLFRNLARRIDTLARYYGDSARLPDFGELVRASAEVRSVDKRIRWHDWTRYSSRQHTRMQMGGVVGELHLEGDSVAPYWPYLWLGQWIHVGKATSMGLGRYQLGDAASLPPRRAARDRASLTAVEPAAGVERESQAAIGGTESAAPHP